MGEPGSGEFMATIVQRDESWSEDRLDHVPARVHYTGIAQIRTTTYWNDIDDARLTMNIVQKGAHPMRIIALPLARVKKSQGAKTSPYADIDANTMLVFYHFDLISPPGGREDLSWHRKTLKSVTNKVADLWTGLGKAPKGSWKVSGFPLKVARKIIHAKQLWTYELGERIADRVEFEELALRSVDPSLGPTFSLTGTSKQTNESQLLRSLPKVCVLQPGAVDSSIFFPYRYHSFILPLYILLVRRLEQIMLCIQLSLTCEHFWRVVDRNIEGVFIYGCSSLLSPSRLH